MAVLMAGLRGPPRARSKGLPQIHGKSTLRSRGSRTVTPELVLALSFNSCITLGKCPSLTSATRIMLVIPWEHYQGVDKELGTVSAHIRKC